MKYLSLDEKLYDNILIDEIPHEFFIDPTSLCIWFKKIEGFIKIFDGTKNFILFGYDVMEIIIEIDIL